MIAPGRFISLEGGEGVGKSTQARALAAALRARGLEVVETREPGGSAGAEAIRGLLLGGASDRWEARAEALLFAAARADHVARTIRPALAAGAWVVCDRFVDSSIAYQGADGLGREAIMALHAIGSEGLLPDRTLLLRLPRAIATAREIERDAGAPDRFGLRDDAYRAAVEQAFVTLAEDDPMRWRMVTAEGNPDEVTARLLDSLADLL
ncbi:dTMP kinase [Sphingomonas nostoxanthinifaciens]|uniref:dTMP kinase n=1 Tax=Sphingomonas nostoxanthinifaciens TaxID=2872652 RepID=UPI001CC1E2E1|nr:dTMP kinase [Sphingomonas nostoxanthinifaciens]UAK22842.1 dTMP kinase [Sphingomonas nostoxanthinifaciens]